MTYNLHLESRATHELRLSQLEEVLADAARHGPECSLIVAGDLNLDASRDAAAVSLARAGFRHAVACPGTPTTPSRRLFESGRKVDWAFVRGPIRADGGQIHKHVEASDHYPISFTLTTPSGRWDHPRLR